MQLLGISLTHEARSINYETSRQENYFKKPIKALCKTEHKFKSH